MEHRSKLIKTCSEFQTELKKKIAEINKTGNIEMVEVEIETCCDEGSIWKIKIKYNQNEKCMHYTKDNKSDK